MREMEVFNAMADGLSTKAAARLLGVAVKTVESHRTRVFAKLGVRSQAQLVAARNWSPPRVAHYDGRAMNGDLDQPAEDEGMFEPHKRLKLDGDRAVWREVAKKSWC